MRDVKSKIASPENPRISTCDVVLLNERYKVFSRADWLILAKFCMFGISTAMEIGEW